MQRHLDTPLALGGRTRILMVEPGMTIRDVGAWLERRQLIEAPHYLRLEMRRLHQAHRIQSGEYALTPGITPRALIDLLLSGRVVQHRITLVEGWTFAQVRAAVAGHEALEHTLTGLAPEDVMARLGRPGEHPEGRFFPDTYSFTRGSTDLQLFERAYRKMEETLAREWATRAEGLPYADAYEALIVASIVEKETAVADERAKVAGVLVRRLGQGIKLQADPTVIYGLGATFNGNLTLSHLDGDTPYNTYRRSGLPPSPIAMTGLAALRAALNPEPGDALYFVARGDGSHHFSATLAEHNEAVARYQLLGRNGKGEDAPP
jgi:UPF0755 protein